MRYGYVPGWKLHSSPRPYQNKPLYLHENATVCAWPSTGGRIELHSASAFELDFLGIEDYLAESNKSADTAEEDAFVQRPRHLVGVFYEYRYGSRDPEHQGAETHTWLGWPEDKEHKGGVWVLKLQWSERREKKTGRISLARTMQDRCRAIEMCGGVFYALPTEEHLVAMEPLPELSGAVADEAERREQMHNLLFDR